MSRAISSATRVAFIKEVTENTIPTNPAWQQLRVTGESMVIARDTIQSQELDPSRNIKDLIIASGMGSGSINFEFSDGTFEDLMESALLNAWSTDVLKNGITPKTFALEVTYETGASDVFKRFSGCQVNQMQLQVQPGQLVTGSMDIMARTSVYANAIVTGATYTAPNAEPVMAAPDFGSLTMTGLTVTCLSNLTLQVNNNLRAQRCVGDIEPSGIGAGNFEVTGEIEMYLDTAEYAFLTAFIANTTTSLQFTLGKVTGKKTTFNMPKVKISGARVVAEGQNQDLMVRANYTALYDSGISATMQITRNVA